MKKEILHYRGRSPQISAYNGFASGGKMQQRDTEMRPRSLLGSVLTDIQFWIPLAVLIGGLIVLSAIH